MGLNSTEKNDSDSIRIVTGFIQIGFWKIFPKLIRTILYKNTFLNRALEKISINTMGCFHWRIFSMLTFVNYFIVGTSNITSIFFRFLNLEIPHTLAETVLWTQLVYSASTVLR